MLINAIFRRIERYRENLSSSEIAILSKSGWTLGTFLQSHTKAADGIPINSLQELIECLLDILDNLGDQKSIDSGTWRNMLFALISFRHCTRLDNGMDIFGPESALAKHIAKRLLILTKHLKDTENLGNIRKANPKSLGISQAQQESSSKNSIVLELIADIWLGKVTVLLKQVQD